MVDWCDKKIDFWPTDINPSYQRKRDGQKMKLQRRGSKGSLKLVWLHIAWHQQRKKDKRTPFPYDIAHPIAFAHVYNCSNQCEHIYYEHAQHVHNRIYIIESRIESSSESA